MERLAAAAEMLERAVEKMAEREGTFAWRRRLDRADCGDGGEPAWR